MYFYELEKKIENFPDIPGSSLSFLNKMVLVLYREDYDQKRNIFIEDTIRIVTPDELLKYGIFLKTGNYNTMTYSREYILFIDNKMYFESEKSFACFADDYCKSYLPDGVKPTQFAFLFAMDSYNEYERYISIITSYFKGIQPFFTFSELVRLNSKQKSLIEKSKLFDDSYHIYVFNNEEYKKLFSFMNTEKRSDFISFFKKSLDNFAQFLINNPIILSEYHSSIQREQTIAALALAYLTFKYKIPVHLEGTMLNNYISRLKHFYCNFDVYTAFDKIQYLLHFPIISFSRKSLVDFLMYIYPDQRQLTVDIFYLDDNKTLVNEKIEISKYRIYDECQEECYYNELISLEDSLIDSQFLHIGNCLVLEIAGKKRVGFINNIDAKFLSIAYSCDPIIKPFTYTLNLYDLINMLPWESLHFYKGKSNMSLQEKFITFLIQQLKKKKIPSLNLENNIHFYMPSYALSGLGEIINVLTELDQGQVGFTDISEHMMNLYSFFKVNMRNNVVNRLSKIVSLNRLRHQSDYLNLYGTNTFLLLNEELLRTKK